MPQNNTAAQIKMPKVDIQMNDAMSISNDVLHTTHTLLVTS